MYPRLVMSLAQTVYKFCSSNLWAGPEIFLSFDAILARHLHLGGLSKQGANSASNWQTCLFWKNATGNCCNRPGLNNTISKLNSQVLPSWFAAMVLVKKDSHLSNISMRAWQNYRRPIEKYTKSPRLWRQQAWCAYWPGDLTRAEALFFRWETEAEWNYSKCQAGSSWLDVASSAASPCPISGFCDESFGGCRFDHFGD